MGTCCERNSSYSFVLIVLKLCMCFLHGMRMCMWIAHNCWISFCHFLDIVNLVIFHPEYIDSGYLLWAQLLLHFWNFVYVFFMVWGCACGLHIIVASIFVSFHPLYIDCVSTSHTILLCPLLKLMLHLCPPPPTPPPHPPPHSQQKKVFFSYFRYKK